MLGGRMQPWYRLGLSGMKCTVSLCAGYGMQSIRTLARA